MDYDTYNQSSQAAESSEYETLGRYTAKTFGWMFMGLLVTFLVSLFSYLTGTIFLVFQVPYLFMILGIVELIVVVILSARITKMSVVGARALFLFYAVLNGVVFATYFLLFEAVSLIYVFGATSLFLGIMAAIGYTTKADLSKLRNFLFGGILFLAGFWLLSIFLDLTQFETIICYVGIFIFLVVTAYDTQKIKTYHEVYSQNPEMAKKASIFSALQLYLDFINLFLYLIRIIGRRK